mmetsp:Transcript_14550/g.29291  ORF Transcript_14550/g.29291 Transcript_14550/m.29291 type:complete len:209 (-) Transcript_14550:21-647(-)
MPQLPGGVSPPRPSCCHRAPQRPQEGLRSSTFQGAVESGHNRQGNHHLCQQGARARASAHQCGKVRPPYPHPVPQGRQNRESKERCQRYHDRAQTWWKLGSDTLWKMILRTGQARSYSIQRGRKARGNPRCSVDRGRAPHDYQGCQGWTITGQQPKVRSSTEGRRRALRSSFSLRRRRRRTLQQKKVIPQEEAEKTRPHLATDTERYS